MDENIICLVKNRSSSKVCYIIPEDGIRREFAPGETKKIKYSELEKLSYQSGGMNMMTHFLQIKTPSAVTELSIHTEPEYHMSEEDIKALISTKSVEEFMDAIDFAPVGVLDLIKKYAVDLPLENTKKIEYLKEKTGFDVVKALANLKAEQAEEESKPAPTGRRVKVEEKAVIEDAAPVRRTTSNYKVVKTAE